MIDSLTFADVLFLLLVCVITGGILTLVNRKSSVEKKSPQDAVEASEETAADEEN